MVKLAAEPDGFQLVCKGELLTNSGNGYLFHINRENVYTPAFVIRYENSAHGFLNRCAHQALELDWNKGEFFDSDGRFLICATHGALYAPENGKCISGRCHGKGLIQLNIKEVDETIFVQSDYPLKIRS